MTIAYVSSGAEGSAASGNITLGAPAGSSSGDVWIAAIHSSDQAAHSMSADWTQIAQGNGGGTTSRLSVWWHRYTGVTPSLVVTHSGGQSPIGGIAAFSGIPAGVPVNVVGAITGGTDASIEHASINVVNNLDWVVVVNGSADDNARTLIGAELFEDSTAGTQNAFITTAGTPDGSVYMLVFEAGAGATGSVVVTQAAADPWASVMFGLTVVAPAKSLAAAAGAYAVTGTAATPKRGRVNTAAAGSYALSGTAATLAKGKTLAAGAGSYALTGTAATLRSARKVAADAGSYALTGTAAALTAAKRLVAGAGSYALTGSDATLTKSSTPGAFSLAADAGAYALTGTPATLRASRRVAAAAGSYSLTGTAASLERGRKVAANAGAYTLAGTAATLRRARIVAAAAGGYALTGSAASLLRTGAYAIVAGPGSYAVTGSPATLSKTTAAAAQIDTGGSGNASSRRRRRNINEDEDAFQELLREWRERRKLSERLDPDPDPDPDEEPDEDFITVELLARINELQAALNVKMAVYDAARQAWIRAMKEELAMAKLAYEAFLEDEDDIAALLTAA